MKEVKNALGDSLTMTCSGCDSEQPHTIEAVTKQGRISKAKCDTCQSTSTFNRGVKTSVARGNAKAALPYDRTLKYRKGQAMNHAVFGHGEVTAVLEPHKIDVLFGDQTRRLIHAQS